MENTRVLNTVHQSFFLSSNTVWDIYFDPNSCPHCDPRSTFVITCTNISSNPKFIPMGHLENGYVYVIDHHDFASNNTSFICLDGAGPANVISNMIVLGSKTVSSGGDVQSIQYNSTPIRVVDIPVDPFNFQIFDHTFNPTTFPQNVSISFLIEEVLNVSKKI